MSQHIDHPAATVRMTGAVAVCSPNERTRDQLAAAIALHGHTVHRAAGLEPLKALLGEQPVAACLLDEPDAATMLPELDAGVRRQNLSTQFVILPALGARVDRSQLGTAFEVLDPPHTPERIGRALFAAVGRARVLAENRQLKCQRQTHVWDLLVGQSPAMQQAREQLHAAAESDRPVLIRGEPGAGATAAARALHAARDGGRRPFLSVRCGVLTSAVAAEVLFGPAGELTPDAGGRLMSAAQGSLLLDDIDALAFPLQDRLADVLTTGHFRPHPALPGQPLACRIIATTHLEARQLVAEASLHPRLYRPLSTHVISLPSLRERRSDIGALAEHFLAESATREGRPALCLSADALRRLEEYRWPGNVRELENVIARCCALETGRELTAEMIAPWLDQGDDAGPDVHGLTLREMERKLIEATFNRFEGNRELTARALEIGLRTLSGKLREYGYPPRGGPGSNRLRRAA
jgi:DNA-binding NtrC family response regulator